MDLLGGVEFLLVAQNELQLVPTVKIHVLVVCVWGAWGGVGDKTFSAGSELGD